ncbi:MAG: dethiobiotin synthase [Nitrosopumilaceae archaeon]
MKDLFISGTDTDVGKTFVTAGIAASLKKMGKDVGIMKPFAAGTPQKTGYKSEDVQLLSNAAQINDAEDLINPYFFQIPASPFTATKNLGIQFNVKTVIDCYKQLSSKHEILLIEGIGGVMTPILKDYFVVNLIKEMNLETILITSSRIGTVNHTIMTCKICHIYGIDIGGIVINDLVSNGYPLTTLKRDLEQLTNIPVIGSVPYVKNFDLDKLSQIIMKSIPISSLFN